MNDNTIVGSCDAFSGDATSFIFQNVNTKSAEEESVDIKGNLENRTLKRNPVDPNCLIVGTERDLIDANFEGPCKFGFIFPGTDNQQTSNVRVSNILHSVYLKMNTTIVVKFTLDPSQATTTDLYVRATLKYRSMDNVQFPVDRCKVHSLEDDPLNKSHEFEALCKCVYHNLAGHVIRSPSRGAIYCYDPISKRHSVLSPLKSRSHDVVYSLNCKSSCPKGIDRRPIQIVFTLETIGGLILGRTSLNVKISTCPKRDRDRQEAESATKMAKRRKDDKSPTLRSLESEEREICSIYPPTPVDTSHQFKLNDLNRIKNQIEDLQKVAKNLLTSVTQLLELNG